MKSLKLISIFLITTFFSCRQKNITHITNPDAAKLANTIIPFVSFINNPDSCKKAITILDSATHIDSNCFLCYHNKLMFLNSLKQYDKSIIAVNHCIRINPFQPDLYLKGGIFYEKIEDTLSSKKYFLKSLEISSALLDTMDINNNNYEVLTSNKAVSLIMLGETKKANELLIKFSSSQLDTILKKNILLFLNRNKKELIEQMTAN